MKKLILLLVIVLSVMLTFGACESSGGTTGEATISISFNTDGKVRISNVKVNVGEIPQIPETPEVEGYVFAGWFFDSEFTDRYFFDYALEKNTTLYAKFYDITLGEYSVISNVDQLIAIKDAPDAKYLLARDINCQGNTLEPIVTFSGELEGNGYKVFNFAITKEAENVAFINTNEGTVKNLSFADFIYAVVRSSFSYKYYGVVCGINKGTVENCHVLDSTLKVTYTSGKDNGANGDKTEYVTTAIGGIVGNNKSIVKKCTNKMSFILQASSFGSVYAFNTNHFYTSHTSAIGGIVGQNEKEGTVSECANFGNFDTTFKVNNVYGLNTICLGGCIGYNIGEAQHCSSQSQCNVNQLNYDSKNDTIGGFAGNNTGTITDSYSNTVINFEGLIKNLYLGGFVSYNNGEIYNSYSNTTANIITDYTSASCVTGGFVSCNNGQIYNSYSNTNANILTDSASSSCVIGGFVANNELLKTEEAFISKCFATGNFVTQKEPTQSGYFAASNTGSIQTCIYSDELTLTLKTTEVDEETSESVETLTAIEPTCTEGEAKPQSEILSVNFLESTLYFDRTIWFLVEGEYPTLR